MDLSDSNTTGTNPGWYSNVSQGLYFIGDHKEAARAAEEALASLSNHSMSGMMDVSQPKAYYPVFPGTVEPTMHMATIPSVMSSFHVPQPTAYFPFGETPRFTDNVYVPPAIYGCHAIEEESKSFVVNDVSKSNISSLGKQVDIATANVVDLQLVPNISRYFAQKILDFRKERVEFNLETLLEHKIIKPKFLDLWLEYSKDSSSTIPFIGSESIAKLWSNMKEDYMRQRKSAKKETLSTDSNNIVVPLNGRTSRVNLDTAEICDLIRVPGISRYYANKIILARTRNDTLTLDILLDELVLKYTVLDSWLVMENSGSLFIVPFLGNSSAVELWRKGRAVYFEKKRGFETKSRKRSHEEMEESAIEGQQEDPQLTSTENEENTHDSNMAILMSKPTQSYTTSEKQLEGQEHEVSKDSQQPPTSVFDLLLNHQDVFKSFY